MNDKEQMSCDPYRYGDKPIKEYMLTASTILTGRGPWMRLPDFIRKFVTETEEFDRDYLYREEFKPFLRNFNDYLRVCCQLGLIEIVGGQEQDEWRKRYRPTESAKRLSEEDDIETIRRIIADCILNIVRADKETNPEERHVIFLLWLFLKIRNSGFDPQEHDFMKPTDKPGSHYPRIRLNFAASLCHLLFGDKMDEERQFLAKWEEVI